MRGPKKKEKIICPRCNRLSQPVRGYCKNCATFLVGNGQLKKVLIDDTPKKLSLEQEEVLFGLMLGDGCLYKDKETHTPYLTVVRTLEDKNYLKYNYEFFKEFCKRGIVEKETFDNRTQKIYKNCKFTTRRCSVFEKYYSMWYFDKTKTIPRDISLTPLTLAIWFCDDGNIRPTCSPWRYRIKLSTHCFSEDDVRFIADLLSKTIRNNVNILNAGKGQFTIDISDKGARSFLEIIDPIFPGSMERKAYWRKTEALFEEGYMESYTGRIGVLKDEYGRFKKV